VQTLTQNSVVDKFLNLKKPGSQNIYAHGLAQFQKFYEPQGTIEDFLDRVEQYLKQSSWRERQDMPTPTNVLKDFVGYLKVKGLSPNSVRSYVSAVQRLCKSNQLSISLLDVGLPAAEVKSEKYSWTLEQIGKFIDLFAEPMYKSLAAALFQSGLSLIDCLPLEYEAIREEYEKGVCPICLSLRRHKTNVQFMTFLGSWSVGLLRSYLQGKHLEPKDRLFDTTKESVDSYFRARARSFLGSWSTPRNPARPHSLRSAFKTLANKANVIDNFKVEYFMGHDLNSMDTTYTSMNREDWRATYSLIEPFLTPKSEAIVAGSPEDPF
jgi:integrase